jgi:hypothetical protein
MNMYIVLETVRSHIHEPVLVSLSTSRIFSASDLLGEGGGGGEGSAAATSVHNIGGIRGVGGAGG